MRDRPAPKDIQCRAGLDIVLSALEQARRDLAFLGGCTHTDRPDLPLSPETSWQSDVSGTLSVIDAAIAAMCLSEKNVIKRHARLLGWIAVISFFVNLLSFFWANDFAAGIGVSFCLVALGAGWLRLRLLSAHADAAGGALHCRREG